MMTRPLFVPILGQILFHIYSIFNLFTMRIVAILAILYSSLFLALRGGRLDPNIPLSTWSKISVRRCKYPWFLS